MDSIAYSCWRKSPTLRKIRPSKLGLLTNKRRNENYDSLPLGCSTPVSSSAKGPRRREAWRLPKSQLEKTSAEGALACCFPQPEVTVAVMEAQEIARKERIASLRPGILGANQRRKRRMPCERRKKRRETTTGRRVRCRHLGAWQRGLVTGTVLTFFSFANLPSKYHVVGIIGLGHRYIKISQIIFRTKFHW